MGQVGVGWRVWAVLVCLQVAVVCADVNLGNRSQAERNLLDWDADADTEARGKKKKKLKYIIAVLAGVLIIKGIIIPLALKAVSLVAGKAFLLGALSLILSSIIGFKQIAQHGWDRMGQAPIMKDRGEVTDTSYMPIPVPTEAMYHKISTDHYWTRK